MAGFADSYALAADKCKATVKSVSLRVLARVLLDADSLAVDSALDRAAAAYRIVEHLAQGEPLVNGQPWGRPMFGTGRQSADMMMTMIIYLFINFLIHKKSI